MFGIQVGMCQNFLLLLIAVILIVFVASVTFLVNGHKHSNLVQCESSD